MTIHRALLTATAIAALALPSSASADPIVECSPDPLLGPVTCEVEETQREWAEDPPVVECRVTFLIGPVMCRVERTMQETLDPGDA
jgi:hypothetical protein